MECAMRKTINRHIIALLTALLFPGFANADISVSLKLDRHEATMMDTVRMVVKVSGVRSSDSRPVIKGIDDFDVIQGSTSSRVEIINGKMSTGIEYIYSLQPKKTGTFTIGPAAQRLKGNRYQSNTATLTITKPKQVLGTDQGPLFLNASISTDEVYLEEQAIYILKIYRQMDISNVSLSLPESQNMTFQQLGKPFEYQSSYNNQPYQVLEVRYALTPTAVGVFGIPSARMNMTVIQRRRQSPFNLFDDPFFANSLGPRKTIVSEPLELKVLPLPEKNRPMDFSGLVGQFQIDSKLEPSTVKAGESATLTVTLIGLGNIKRIPDLKMPELDHVKVYADQPVLKEQIDEKGRKGHKTMKWALVPEQAGTHHLPRLQVSFFDTGARAYKTIKTASQTLSVIPGQKTHIQTAPQPAQAQSLQTPTKKEVTALGHDILPVHTSMKNLTSASGIRARSWMLWVILVVPVLGYAGTRLGLVMSNKSPATIAATKARKASKRLLLECCDTEINSSRTVDAWKNYLNDRFGLSLGSLTAQEAFDILTDKGVCRSTSQKVFELIQSLEDAVYSGKGNETCGLGNEIRELVKQVEKEIR